MHSLATVAELVEEGPHAELSLRSETKFYTGKVFFGLYQSHKYVLTS
jgi:hypothetical protein